jgi:hypothetical protein
MGVPNMPAFSVVVSIIIVTLFHSQFSKPSLLISNATFANDCLYLGHTVIIHTLLNSQIRYFLDPQLLALAVKAIHKIDAAILADQHRLWTGGLI